MRALGAPGLAGQAVADARQRQEARGQARPGRAGRTAWARGAHGLGALGARPGRTSARRLGVLAGSAGLVWCTVHLAQL